MGDFAGHEKLQSLFGTLILGKADQAFVNDLCSRLGSNVAAQVYGYIAGREARQAELAAVADALLQDSAQKDILLKSLIRPLADAQQQTRDARAEKAAATKVDFFAMQTTRS